MDRVLSTASSLRQQERGRVADALSASLRRDAADDAHARARAADRGASEMALHFMFYCPQVRAPCGDFVHALRWRTPPDASDAPRAQDDDFLINRAVATLTRQTLFLPGGERRAVRYAHVELSFPADPAGLAFADGKTMGFSITQTSRVYMRLKSWREEYHTVVVYVPARAYAALYGECVRVAAQNIRFDRWGMYAGSIAPARTLPPRSRAEHGTYCSKVITELLQQFAVAGGGIQALDAPSCNPNTMFMALQAQ